MPVFKIAGTGSRKLALHRNAMDHIYGVLTSMLEEKRREHSDLVVISGMAEGFDEVIAHAAVGLNIPFHAYIPNDGYGDYYWRKNSITGFNRNNDWEALLSKAASVKYVCNRIYQDGMHSNFVRNCAMVEDSDNLWALINREMVDDANSLIALSIPKLGSGTKHCVEYAKSVGREITYINLDFPSI